MEVEQAGRAHIAPATVARLTAFTAVSIAFHALTLVAYAPAGVLSSKYSGPVGFSALQATLMPVATEAPAQEVEAIAGETAAIEGLGQDLSPSAEKAEEPKSRTTDVLASAPQRTGAPGGLDIPTPDKWFTAQEVDVRAEPLTTAELVYPSELVRSGAVGHVRILLFIDERGIVRKSQIAANATDALFDEAATKAWINVRFSPAEKNGIAVKSQKLLEMDFLPF